MKDSLCSGRCQFMVGLGDGNSSLGKALGLLYGAVRYKLYNSCIVHIP